MLQGQEYYRQGSANGWQADQKGEVEHITAGYLHVDVSPGPGTPHTVLSSVKPLDHTPPVTDAQSQEQTMQAGYCAHSLEVSSRVVKAVRTCRAGMLPMLQ